MSSGTRQLFGPSTVLEGYRASDMDQATTTQYFGFVDQGGAWYILRMVDEETIRYVAGASDYATNWTNRASLSYDYYNNVF